MRLLSCFLFERIKSITYQPKLTILLFRLFCYTHFCFEPYRFYQLTLYNNAHIDTNLHTHGLHVSGVGTVDDVTRVAKPGECLVYDVSLRMWLRTDCCLLSRPHPFLTLDSILDYFELL